MKRESKNLEYKEKLSKSYLKTVCAFANYTDGTIIFGISDDYQIKGVENPTDYCLRIENQINDSIKPKPNYSLSINKNKTVSLNVKKGNSTPYLLNGKTYKRNDSSTIEADELDYKRLLMEGINQNYEELKSDTQKLSFKYLGKELKDKLGIKAFNEDTLISLNLYNSGIGYNRAALLLADKNNCAGLDIAVFGSNISEIKKRVTLSGESIVKQYYDVLEIFKDYYVSEKINSGVRTIEEKIPVDAFREAVANGLIHRVWDVNANTKIEMHPDKIVVSSPGGLLPGISKEQYTKGSFSLLRNPIISNVFYRLKIVEIFATGIKRINDLYSDSLSKPIYDVMDDAITITLPLINNIQLGINEEKIISSVSGNREYRREEIEELTGLSRMQVIRSLNEIVNSGLMIKKGKARNTVYIKNNAQ